MLQGGLNACIWRRLRCVGVSGVVCARHSSGEDVKVDPDSVSGFSLKMAEWVMKLGKSGGDLLDPTIRSFVNE